MPYDQNGNRNAEDLTVGSIFSLAPDKPELAAHMEANSQEIQKQIPSLPRAIRFSRVQAEVASLIPALLETNLLESWAQAWKKYEGLKADVEKSRKSPAAVVLSPLAEHSIDSILKPYIELFTGPKKIGKVPIDVTLTTKIKGLLLGLKNGVIVSLELGRCECKGKIAIRDVVLMQRELTLDLPGRITLKRGIPLGGNGGAAGQR